MLPATLAVFHVHSSIISHMADSSGSEGYRTRTCVQQLDRYFWPFTATNNVKEAVFTSRTIFVIFRLAAFCGLVYAALYTWREHHIRSLAYMEVWGLLLSLALYFLLVLNYCCEVQWKATHFLYELTWCVELGFTAVFWAFLYPQGEGGNVMTDVLLHGGVDAVLILDYLNNKIYFYRRHCRLILLLTLLYVLINVPISLIVFSAYRHLSYSDAWTALGLVMELLFVLLAFLFGGLLDGYKYRWLRKPLDDPLGNFDDSTVYNSESGEGH